MKRKIASHYALINGRLERGIVVEVEASGIITDIIHATALDSMAGVEFYPGILTAGFINAHCHLELSYLRGAIAEGLGYGGFASAIGAVRGGYSDQERIHAAEVADALMWQQGVEAVADIANDELVMEVKRQSKIEYHTLFEFFGLRNSSTEDHLTMAQRHPNSHVTPHSTYSVQDAPFRDICLKNRELMSLHFLESKSEAELFSLRGALWQWYERMGWECDFMRYGTPTERVTQCVSSDTRLLLVHATEATKADIELVESHTTKATWVLCPESNRYISNACPPVELLRDAGARIAIGSDSLASARTLSIVDNLKLIDSIPLADLLTYATLNGATALGIEREKGSIEIGKRPGLVVIEGANLNGLRLTPEASSRRII